MRAYASPEGAAGLLGVAGLASAGLASAGFDSPAGFDSAFASEDASDFAAGLEEALFRKSGTDRARRVAHLLQEFLLVAAAVATVLVDRHGRGGFEERAAGCGKEGKSHFNTSTCLS
jgi:hypothetical protein